MPIAVLAIALAAFVYALVAAPGFRVWGLALAAAAAIGLGIYLAVNQPESELEAQRIAPEEVALDRLEFDLVGRGARLSGRVRNGSRQWRLRDMTLLLRLRDCPDVATDTADCPVIGEATDTARPDTPPAQIRGFAAQFVFANLPPVAGDLRWDLAVTGTRATD